MAASNDPEHTEVDTSNDAPPRAPSKLDDHHLLSGKKLAVVFAAMLLALFLIALDQTILSTALPRIASDFNAFSKQGWIASSYVLTNTAFILFFAQVLRIYPSKYVLISTIIIFEIGSALSGAARDADFLIAGRAVSGVGGAGILTSILQVIAQATRLEDRPRLFSLFESVFALSSIIGPLIGGAFTDRVTWRWCFYINLPIGGASIVAIALLLESVPPLGSEKYDLSAKALLKRTADLDWVGAVLCLGAVTSLVLALQWGGNDKPWNSADVIACLVLVPVLTAIFLFWERYVGDGAMVPLAIFKRGVSIYSICSFAVFNRFIYLIFTYFIPIYYEAARHRSAVTSAVDLLPLMLSVTISIVSSGQLVACLGRYWPWLVIGPVFGAVGSGLMYTVTATTSIAALVGFQILVGICIGTTLQNILFAMQAEFDDTPKLISQATGMVNFMQFLGGTIGLAVAQVTFSSQLAHNLGKYAPEALFTAIKESPLSIYSSAIPDALIPDVVRAYVKSLSTVYVIGVPASVLSLAFAVFISNINIKKPPVIDMDTTEMERNSNVPQDDNVVSEQTITEKV